MTKEVKCCFGDPEKNVILKTCEDCSCQATCQGHTEYIVKFLPLIVEVN